MDVYKICRNLALLTGLPVALKDSDGIRCTGPAKRQISDIVNALLQSEIPDEIYCGEITSGIFYGRIGPKEKNYSIIIGPVPALGCSFEQARKILKYLSWKYDQLNVVYNCFAEIPSCSMNRLAQCTSFLYFLIENIEIPLEKLMISAPIPNATDIDQLWEERRTGYYHDTAEYERTMYSLIRYGNSAGLYDFLKDRQYMGNEGILGKTLTRHHKNAIISSIAIASHSANEGGIPYETAMNLADQYVEKTENASDISELYQLHRNMLLTYARLVEQQNLNLAKSTIVIKIRHYILKHLHENIQINKMAEDMGMHRSYLSTCFSRETGKQLNNYIHECKIMEAKRLLVTTDYPIIEISEQLGYANQSNFSATFKHFEKVSPSEYRKHTIYLEK